MLREEKNRTVSPVPSLTSAPLGSETQERMEQPLRGHGRPSAKALTGTEVAQSPDTRLHCPNQGALQLSPLEHSMALWPLFIFTVTRPLACSSGHSI